MTAVFLVSAVLAAACGVLSAALYIAWPRRQTAEEWIYHRRAVSGQSNLATSSRRAARLRLPSWLSAERYTAYLTSLNADLALLQLADSDIPAQAPDLIRTLARTAGSGAVLGGGLGFALWLATAGGEGPLTIVALAVAAAVVLPLASWLRIRRRAHNLRMSVNRRLARVLTGARMVLESGAATPERALVVAVGIYDDPATQLLREGLRLREVRRIPLEDGLDEVAERYALPSLYRLADAFRLGGRYGTQMAAVISGFAQDLRRTSHAEFRERMTRAPVLMTLPALAFFVAPLLILVLFLVFAPLSRTLGQL
jgi:Flp pilus assembly protein TadB